jgi:hypothetical protein
VAWILNLGRGFGAVRVGKEVVVGWQREGKGLIFRGPEGERRNKFLFCLIKGRVVCLKGRDRERRHRFSRRVVVGTGRRAIGNSVKSRDPDAVGNVSVDMSN